MSDHQATNFSIKGVSMIYAIPWVLAFVVGAGAGGVEENIDLRAFAANLEKSVQTGKKTIFTAAEEGDLEFINKYLADGGSINRGQLYGGTMLYYAVRGGREKIVETLLAEGADPGIPNATLALTPLALSRELLDDSPDLQSRIIALLERAVQSRATFTAEVEALIAAGNVEALQARLQDSFKYVGKETYDALLDLAVMEKQEAFIEFLANQLPNRLVPDVVEKRLAENTFMSESTIDRIRSSLREKEKDRLFIYYKYQIVEGYIGAEDKKSPVFTNINAPVFGGRTLLIHAIQQENVDLVAFLLTSGASRNAKDNQGLTPMNHVVKSQAPDDVKKQLKALLVNR